MSLVYEHMHIPVLLEEVSTYLCNSSSQVFLDATLGTGGHAIHILERFKNLKLIGIDMDEDALNIAEQRLKGFKDRVYLFHENFKNLDIVLTKLGIKRVDASFFDLGLSTMQLESKRGFSFDDDTFLDMRMDRRTKKTAYEVVNFYGYEALFRIIKEFGEEEEAERIAKAIVEERKREAIRNAKRLSDIIVHAKKKKSRLHPATKTFQAIRIEVNDEIENLKEALPKSESFLSIKGRLGVISFHSLEDRIVKEFMKNSVSLIPITKKPVRPSIEEIKLNRRARSAKLRVGEKRDE